MRGISLHSHSHLCHLTCVFLKHCGQKTLCAELYKTRHEEDADRRGLASDRHSPGPPGLIFGQRYLMDVCIAVSADFRGYLLGYCVIRLQDEEDERKHSKCVTVQACCLHSLCWSAAEFILFGIGFTVRWTRNFVIFGCVNILADVILKHGTLLRQAIFNSLQLRFAVCRDRKLSIDRSVCAEMQFVTGCIYAFYLGYTIITEKMV